MKDDFLDIMSGKKADYTLEEIEKAEKLKKKNGGSLTDNLIKVTGRRPSAETFSFVSSMKGSDPLADMNNILMQNSAQLDKELKELNKNIAQDYGVTKENRDSFKKPDPLLTGEDAMKAFDGLEDELKKEIYGQDEFLHKLVIAFKRPYVMLPEGVKALNSIYVCGSEDSGKHLAVTELVKQLKTRKVIKSEKTETVDLGIYTDATMEKVFLQDMYSAIAGEEQVIIFENFENCHPSFLIHIASLVTNGEFMLPERYILKDGQMIGVQNSLASDTVGSINAKGKYLVFISKTSLNKAAGIMGAPFVDALGDICETGKPAEDVIKKIAERENEELIKLAKDRFTYEINVSEAFTAYAVKCSEKQAGVKGVLDFYAKVTKALAQARLEGTFAAEDKLILDCEDDKILAVKGEEKKELFALLPGAYKGEIEKIREEIDAIVGLEEIKEYVLGLEEYYKVQKRREEEGLKTGGVSKHMIFTGSPGTGKTTIARIISKYLKAIGVLSGGQLVEVSRADLVGKYVGHTAPLTQKVLTSAIGGVLFIDEAYSLYRGKDDTFGLEAIDTLVKGIEDNRENLIVILAGYSYEMSEFLTSNSGLKSRFPNVINFPDYTGEELLKISKCIASSKGYTIDESADGPLKGYFDAVQAVRAADAGNG
nr:AAA family ATPase [Lachnospiraceae bacterium]